MEGGAYHFLNFPAYRVCEVVCDWNNKIGLDMSSVDEFRMVTFGEGKRGTILEEKNEHHIILHVELITPSPFLNRELYMRRIWQEVSHDNYIVHAQSIEFPPEAYSDKHVKATFSATLWVRGAIDGNSCHCAYVNRIDLGGSFNKIPAVVNRRFSMSVIKGHLLRVEQILMVDGKGEKDEKINDNA